MRAELLKDICHFQKGETGLAKAEPGEYSLVTTGAERKTCNTYQFDTKAVCIPLVSSTGHGHASLKNVHYQEGRFALGTILVALTAINVDELNIQFLHLYLSQLKDQVLVPLMSGAANVALSVTKIKGIEIPLPTIERQTEIVEQFRSIVQEEDQLKTELTHQQTLLKKLRQQILQEAIEGKLTQEWRKQNPDIEPASELLKRIQAEKAQLIKDKKIKKQKTLPAISEEEKPFALPDGWVWCRIDDISIVGTGATPLTSESLYYGGDINWMTSADTSFDFVTKTKATITEKALSETNCKVYPVGTLVVAMYGQGKTRGQVTELKIDAATNQACVAISLYVPSFDMNQFLKSHFKKIYHEIRELAQGGAQPNLNMGKIKANIVALPPLAEQKAIVAKVEKLLALCDQLESQITSNQNHSEQLMQAVLKEAFTSEATELVVVHA